MVVAALGRPWGYKTPPLPPIFSSLDSSSSVQGHVFYIQGLKNFSATFFRARLLQSGRWLVCLRMHSSSMDLHCVSESTLRLPCIWKHSSSTLPYQARRRSEDALRHSGCAHSPGVDSNTGLFRLATRVTVRGRHVRSADAADEERLKHEEAPGLLA